MSDEYASSGFQGSLVNPCAHTPALDRMKYLLYSAAIEDVLPPREGDTYPPSTDYATKNYPPPGDSTYIFYDTQPSLVMDRPSFPPATSSGGRRTGLVFQPDNGQPPSGGSGPDLRGQQQDEAPQGRDPSAESLDTRKEAAEALAARYRASRERLHGGQGSGGG